MHEIVAREERRRAVVAAVLGLEEPYRSAVLLRFYEGLAPRELAKRLRLPIETVRTRLKRGVEQIRARIAREPAVGREGLRAWLAPIAGPLTSGGATAKAAWLVAVPTSILLTVMVAGLMLTL